MMMKIKNKKGLIAPQGFKVAAASAGIRQASKKDMMLLVSEVPCQATGLFTTNQFAAAPVKWSKQALNKSKWHQGLLINSGSANACTGKQGDQDVKTLCQKLAKALNCPIDQVLQASTGVIGQLLPINKMAQALPKLIHGLQAKEGLSAAEAIMTTDTRPKLAETTVAINGQLVTVGGIAKGSGMIHPNMATMLAVVTTDISMTKSELTKSLKLAAKGTFNAISVDGENSTNDSVFLLANGLAGKQSCPKTEKSKQLFIDALTLVLDQLAEQIVLDGEGASKFIEVIVCGAKNDKEAMTAARAIGDSQLVKTAIYGEDANWGRILQSLGATTISLKPDKVRVKINGLQLVKNGMDAGVSMAKGNQTLKHKRIVIEINLTSGSAKARYRTCDLTKGYIDINGGYRS